MNMAVLACHLQPQHMVFPQKFNSPILTTKNVFMKDGALKKKHEEQLLI